MDADTTDTKRPATASKQPRKRSTSDPAEHSDAAQPQDGVRLTEDNEVREVGALLEEDDHQNGIIDEPVPEAEALQPSKEIDESSTTVAADNGSERPVTPPSDDLKPLPLDTMPMSPQNKRNREQFISGQGAEPTVAIRDPGDKTNLTSDNTPFAKESTPSMQEPEKKKSRDGSAAGPVEQLAASPTKVCYRFSPVMTGY